jgi:heme/copper-type cytochrome/quinol oxidase subunit 2
MSSSIRSLFGSVLAPGRTFRRLRDDVHPFGRGLRIVLLTGGLGALTSLALAAAGAVPMAPIFIPVRAENYYAWQALFTLPLLLMVWVLTSVVVHILGRGSRRGGSLKKTLGPFGFAQAVPLLLVWTVQTVIAVFYGLGMGQQEMVDILSAPSTPQTVFLAIFGAAFAWSFLLACLAASASQKVKWPAALFLGFLAEVLFVGPVMFLLR